MGYGQIPGPIGVSNAGRAVVGQGPLGARDDSWEMPYAERRRDGFAYNQKVVVPRHSTWTSVGAILQAFFAPIDTGERLWVMPETDSYTKVVRAWGPVKSHIEKLKRDVALRSLAWKQYHITQSGWIPRRFGYFRPPNCGWDKLEASPSGTDPDTARWNFVAYLLTGYATEALHTSAIGSFRVMATADEVDLSHRKVIVDVWMYNEMSKRSFGRFAHEWPFSDLPMRSQFMWWNWKEKFNFDEKGNVEPWRGNLAY